MQWTNRSRSHRAFQYCLFVSVPEHHCRARKGCPIAKPQSHRELQIDMYRLCWPLIPIERVCQDYLTLRTDRSLFAPTSMSDLLSIEPAVLNVWVDRSRRSFLWCRWQPALGCQVTSLNRIRHLCLNSSKDRFDHP